MPAYGDRVGILVKGYTVAYHRNGVYGATQNLTSTAGMAHLNATNYGIYNYTAGTTRLDDFTVKTPEKTYDGTSWQKNYKKVWNGTAWVTRAARRWDGSFWK